MDAYMLGDTLITKSNLLNQVFDPTYMDIRKINDINSITKPGIYSFTNGPQKDIGVENTKNVPNGATAYALIIVLSLKNSDYNKVQLWLETNTARIWHRTCHGSSEIWESWKEMAVASQIQNLQNQIDALKKSIGGVNSSAICYVRKALNHFSELEVA